MNYDLISQIKANTDKSKTIEFFREAIIVLTAETNELVKKLEDEIDPSDDNKTILIEFYEEQVLTLNFALMEMTKYFSHKYGIPKENECSTEIVNILMNMYKVNDEIRSSSCEITE